MNQSIHQEVALKCQLDLNVRLPEQRYHLWRHAVSMALQLESMHCIRVQHCHDLFKSHLIIHTSYLTACGLLKNSFKPTPICGRVKAIGSVRDLYDYTYLRIGSW